MPWRDSARSRSNTTSSVSDTICTDAAAKVRRPSGRPASSSSSGARKVSVSPVASSPTERSREVVPGLPKQPS
ncbi:MAG: hypothetical protein CVU56_21065 [Deltaproteobacteria bacterium HGW-Deltaproteobacteria-14]|nr:MAG: hypothetical protein CVU56_21065 [Deltaproteobacteria bacterium HGW-Deltaproteobacteria-14]